MKKLLVFFSGILLGVIISFLVVDQTNLFAKNSTESQEVIQKNQPSEIADCPYLNSLEGDLAKKSGRECPFLKDGAQKSSGSCPYLKSKKHIHKNYSL
jgi:hypothetical protein